MNEGEASSGLTIAHDHPGRLRVRADAFRDAEALAEQTRTGLVQLGGVESIRHDARTGSLLVEYDPEQIDSSTLLGRIVELSALELVPREEASHRDAATRVYDFARRLDAIAQELTNGRLDLGVVVPGGLAALGVYSFFRGPHKRMPRWDSLIYWAYAVFSRAHPGPEPAAERGRPAAAQI